LPPLEAYLVIGLHIIFKAASTNFFVAYWFMNRNKTNAAVNNMKADAKNTMHEMKDSAQNISSNMKEGAQNVKDKVDKSIKGMQDKAGGSTTPYKDIKTSTKLG
jgi:mannitol-specific phosphotransferase system IIBC component